MFVRELLFISRSSIEEYFEEINPDDYPLDLLKLENDDNSLFYTSHKKCYNTTLDLKMFVKMFLL